MFLKQIYDPYLSQYAYLIGCQKTGEALIIDAERDVDRYLEIAAENDLKIAAATETHIHADFLSGTRELVESCQGIKGYLSSEGGENWQYQWAKNDDRVTLLKDGDSFSVGNVEITAVHLSGHTPEHICFLIQDHGAGADEPMAIVSGDFMFVGDVGRPDLLETAAGHTGSREPAARDLFRSILRFAELPDFLEVLPGHGAGSACGKALGSIPFSTTGYEKRFNSAVRRALKEGESAFVEDILDGQPEPPMYFARMKQVNRDGAPVLGSLPQPKQLDPASLAASLGQVTLVDTRPGRGEFMKDHVEGSFFAPFGPKFTEACGSYVQPDTDLVLLVEDPDQVDSLVRQLVRIGLDRIAGYALVGDVLADANFQQHRRSTKVIDTTEISPSDRVLDVRSLGEYKEAHIAGAINVAHTRIVADQDRLPEPGPITVHCGSGMRASLVTPVLERLGFEVTFADGMFADWKKQAAEVATGS